MFIVFEGTDCAGKTTFTKELAKAMGAKYLHFSKPKIDPYTYFSRAFELWDAGKDVVCDRFVLGEMIYAKVFGEKSQWAEGDYERALIGMEMRDAVLVHAWETEATLLKRFKQRGETYVTRSQMLQAQRLFKKEVQRIASAYPGIKCYSIQLSTLTGKKLN